MPPRARSSPPIDSNSASPSASSNAIVYLVIQRRKAHGCLPALVSLALPVISYDEVDATIVNTWNPQPSIWPLE